MSKCFFIFVTILNLPIISPQIIKKPIMKHYFKTISLFTFSILLLSCSTTKKESKNQEITEKYWKLIEIRGEKVTADDFASKEPHLILKSTDNRVTGNGGCNSFFGTYELQANVNRISFSKMGSTKMACMKPTVEDAFLNVLATVDNYTVKNDTLQLNKARMAPLAKFVAVYLK